MNSVVWLIVSVLWLFYWRRRYLIRVSKLNQKQLNRLSIRFYCCCSSSVPDWVKDDFSGIIFYCEEWRENHMSEELSSGEQAEKMQALQKAGERRKRYYS